MFNDQVTDFLNYIVGERGYSHNTYLAYKQDLSKLSKFLSKRNIEYFDCLPDGLITEFLKELIDKGYSEGTRKRIIECIRSFCKFLRSEGQLKERIHEKLISPKIWHKVPNILSEKEVKVFLKQRCNSKYEKMNIAILELLYGSGLRVTELCNLRNKDLEGNCLRVMGKGSKERIIPVSTYFLKALKRYQKTKIKKHSLGPNDYMFSRIDGIQITRFYINGFIKKFTRLAKIDKNISPHTFRHTYATHLLDNGADIRIIQDLLGHSSIQSTTIYLTLSLGQIIRSFKKYHPKYY